MNSATTPNTTLANLAQQQLQYQKLTSDLLSRQQMTEDSLRRKSKIRWEFFFLGVLFFFVSKYVLLRTQFKQVFHLFQSSTKTTTAFYCGDAWNGSAWHIVLGVAYPWLGNIILESPITQDQADFLWMAIRSNWIPTQDQINNDTIYKGPKLNLSPVSYLCGNVLAEWMNATGTTDPNVLINQVSQNPDATPWHWFLSSDPRSQILDKISPDLTALLTQGLWGIIKLIGQSGGGGPIDYYNEIYTKEPAPQGCDTITQVANVSSSAATFSMAGAAFPPAGPVIGALAGIGLGLAQSGSQCSGSSCTIM